MGLFTALSCYVILDYLELNSDNFKSTMTIHSLLGIVLGLFLVFRTNTAYDRWWEGRKLWGAMVNNCRNFSMQINAYVGKGENNEARLWFLKMIPNFAYATKEHLREGVILEELESPDSDFLPMLENIKHKPNRIASMMYEKVNNLYMGKIITGDHLLNLDKELNEFLNIVGACERIRNTPIPYSYTMYIKKFIFTYIITLPFGLATALGYYTIPAVLMVSFVLLSVELIAEEIEDPFGRDNNDLPTDELAAKIKDNVGEIIA